MSSGNQIAERKKKTKRKLAGLDENDDSMNDVVLQHQKKQTCQISGRPCGPAHSKLGKSYNSLLKLVDWNGYELSEFFGWPEDHIEDLFEILSQKRLECDENNKLVFIACGPKNLRRKIGPHKSVISTGVFTQNGQKYTSLRMPEHAVLSEGSSISVTECVFLNHIWRCFAMRDENCTLSNTKNCQTITVDVVNKVVVKKLHNGLTYIAADVNNYTSFDNLELKTHKMTTNKHVVLKVPVGSIVKFNDVPVEGH